MMNEAFLEQLQLTACSKGDVRAFDQIYHQYKKFVFNIVNARLSDTDDALDITQDIFVNLWSCREQLAGIRDFKTYLFVFSRNQVVTAYRKKNIRLKGENYLTEMLEELAEPSAEDHRFARELTLHIDTAVKQFPETMRHCYQLSKNEGKRNIEIAGILNISEKTVRNNVSEALKRLRLNLQNSYSELLTGIITLLVSECLSTAWNAFHQK